MDFLNFFLNIFFPLFPFLKNPSFLTAFPLIRIVFIFFCGIFWGIKFWRDKKFCQTEIEKALEILKEFDPQTIYQNFEKFKQSLSNNFYFGNLWSEFVNTLIITKKEDKNLIYKPIEAKYIFNEENLIFSKINLQFYRAVPGILTGLGILGTFLGLTLGLSRIKLGTSDVNVLKEGIKGLLSGVSMAFSTSVWGIGGSIVFLLFKNRQLKNLLQRVTEFQMYIDKLFIWKSSENFLSEILQQAEEQTAQLKRFNTDLAISIATALDERLAQRLTPALEKLLEAIEELTKTGTTQIAKTISQEAGTEIIKLKDVLVEVRETLQNTVVQSQKTHQEITETFYQFLKTIEEKQTIFSTKLQEIVQSLVSKVKESISYQQEEIKIATSQLTEKFLNSFKELSININTTMNDLINLLTKRVNDLTNQYQIDREKLEGMVYQINGMLENFQITVKEANKMSEVFIQSAEPLKEISTQLVQTVEKTQDISKSLQNTFYSSQEILKTYLSEIQEIITTLNIASQRTQEAWQAYENKFGEIREDLENVLEKIGKELQQYAVTVTKNVEEVLITFDTLLGKAVQHLAGGVEELKEAIEELDEKLEKLSFT